MHFEFRSAAARFLLVLWAITAIGGCASSAPEVASIAEPIVGGTRGGDAAVLWIYNTDSGGLCTGTLITPRVVLTAKHCVQEAGAAGPRPGR